jgi:predicted Zn-ribbon and HTH transcriptional regulator
MTSPSIPELICRSKQAMTAEDARHIANEMRRRRDGRAISPYRCTVCGCWHIGSALKTACKSKCKKRRFA